MQCAHSMCSGFFMFGEKMPSFFLFQCNFSCDFFSSIPAPDFFSFIHFCCWIILTLFYTASSSSCCFFVSLSHFSALLRTLLTVQMIGMSCRCYAIGTIYVFVWWKEKTATQHLIIRKKIKGKMARAICNVIYALYVDWFDLFSTEITSKWTQYNNNNNKIQWKTFVAVVALFTRIRSGAPVLWLEFERRRKFTPFIVHS